MRTHWDNLIKNINKLNINAVNQEIGLGMRNKYSGLNEKFLTEEFNLLFKRQDKQVGRKTFGYNVALTYPEAKKMYDEQELKEYMQQRRAFLRYAGFQKVSGTEEDVLKLSLATEKSREEKVSDIWKNEESALSRVDYKTTREWDSAEWRMVNDFKKQMNSDEAVELAFAITQGDEGTIVSYQEKGDRVLRKKIHRYIESTMSRDRYIENLFID